MAKLRELNDVIKPALTTALFAVYQYCHLGTATHRSTWDGQHVWSPILYALFPHLYICQIFLNLVLWIQRYYARKRLHTSYTPDGFLYAISTILGMHTASRCWHEPPLYIANLGYEKQADMLRLHTIETERFDRRNKYVDDDSFRKIPFCVRLVRLLLQLEQSTYASTIYIIRASTMSNATLYIDHITGAYSISAAVVALALIILHVQPYEWHDKNDTPPDQSHERYSDIDTSNAWVYEGLIAMTLHLITWTSVWSWNLARTVTGLDDSWKKLYQSGWDLFKDNMTAATICLASTFALVFGLMVPTILDIFKPRRSGLTWANHLFRIKYYVGGVIVRVILPIFAMFVGGATWWYAAKELEDVGRGDVRPWNANWTEPNPSVNAVLDSVYCIIC